LHALEREGFDSFGRRWATANIKGVHIDVSKLVNNAERREILEAQRRFHDKGINTVIIREVHRNLERQNVPLMGGIMVREMLATPEPPAINQ
jgi:hypothetical protein